MTMDGYIKRGEAIEAVKHAWTKGLEPSQYIEVIPVADVVPVIHGQWVEYQIPPIICCSNCDWATGIEEKNFQHCPNCGAKMDGGADNG